MKIGDTVPVVMANLHVAEGTIEDISDGKATILIPATRVVMGIRSSLVDLEPEGPERVLLGADEREVAEPVNAPAPVETQAPAIHVSNESMRSMNLDSSGID